MEFPPTLWIRTINIYTRPLLSVCLQDGDSHIVLSEILANHPITTWYYHTQVKTHLATNHQKRLKFSLLRFEGFAVGAPKFSQMIICVSIVRDGDRAGL
jgi:hypothetical protein